MGCVTLTTLPQNQLHPNIEEVQWYYLIYYIQNEGAILKQKKIKFLMLNYTLPVLYFAILHTYIDKYILNIYIALYIQRDRGAYRPRFTLVSAPGKT